MSHALRFQVEILPDLEWSALLGRFRDVEALGFDLAVTGDQFVDSMNPSPVGVIRLLKLNGRFLDNAPHQIP